MRLLLRAGEQEEFRRVLGHGFSPEAAPKYPRRKTGECPPARLLLPGGLGTPIE
jgi:hypothetical protein